MVDYVKDNIPILLQATYDNLMKNDYASAKEYCRIAMDISDWAGYRKVYRKIKHIYELFDKGEYDELQSELEHLIIQFDPKSRFDP